MLNTVYTIKCRKKLKYTEVIMATRRKRGGGVF